MDEERTSGAVAEAAPRYLSRAEICRELGMAGGYSDLVDRLIRGLDPPPADVIRIGPRQLSYGADAVERIRAAHHDYLRSRSPRGRPMKSAETKRRFASIQQAEQAERAEQAAQAATQPTQETAEPSPTPDRPADPA